MESNSHKPLCVDLDGTVIATDSLAESLLVIIKINPLLLLLLPYWVLRGKYYLKSQLEINSKITPEKLPYRSKFLEYVKDEKAKGRKIVLATASMPSIANKIADYLDIFDEVLASENNINLRAENKADALVKRYGEKGFDYAGDSKADIPVWKHADKAILVHPKKSVLRKARKAGNVHLVFTHNYSKFLALVKEIRVYQWVKNILLFLPMLLAHEIFNFRLIKDTSISFIAFSLMASFVYVLNDLLDVEADRIHPTKRNRPIASGKISIFQAFFIIPVLFFASLGISAYYLNFEFTVMLLVYVISNIMYSFHLKKVMILDIIILSTLYTLRLIAGAVAGNVHISPWLIEFSIFFFFSLAAVKRYSELLTLKDTNQTSIKRRGYLVGDIDVVRNFGIISGYLSVMIIAFYVHGQEVEKLYKHPEFLWAISPILLYWISRVWLIAHRGKMNDDPIVFTGKDVVSWVIGLIVGLIALGATL